MQAIGAHGETEKLVVTLRVIRAFSVLPGAPRACLDFRDPTEVSRFKLRNGMKSPLHHEVVPVQPCLRKSTHLPG